MKKGDMMPYIPQHQRTEIDAIVDPLPEMVEDADSMVVSERLGQAVLRIAKGLCLGSPPPSASGLVVDPLIELLNAVGDNDDIAGRLNYAISRIAWALCGHRGRGVRRYARMNAVDTALGLAHDDFRRWVRPTASSLGRMRAVDGALGLAQAEFRRRVVAPYEDEKAESAGDV